MLEKIHTIKQWTYAFIFFANIYLEAYPNKALGLLKYMNAIRLAAARSFQRGVQRE